MDQAIRDVMEKLVKENAYMQDLNLSLEEYEDGYAKGKMVIHDRLLNPYGSVHGGVLYSMADIVAGCAACSRGRFSSTVHGGINFLKPAFHTEYVICEANEVRYGKTVAVYEVKLFDDKEQLIDTGTFTFYLMDRKVV